MFSHALASWGCKKNLGVISGYMAFTGWVASDCNLKQRYKYPQRSNKSQMRREDDEEIAVGRKTWDKA